MSYLPENFKLGRGSPNNHVDGNQVAIHTYNSTDTYSSVFDIGYFPPYFGFNPDSVKIGDIFYANFNGGDFAFNLTQVDNFDYLGELGTYSRVIPNSSTSRSVVLMLASGPQAITIRTIKFGKMIYVSFPFFSQFVSTPASPITGENVIDPSNLPVTSISQEAYVINATARQGYLSYDGTLNTIGLYSYTPYGGASTIGFGGFTLALETSNIG